MGSLGWLHKPSGKRGAVAPNCEAGNALAGSACSWPDQSSRKGCSSPPRKSSPNKRLVPEGKYACEGEVPAATLTVPWKGREVSLVSSLIGVRAPFPPTRIMV